VCSQRVQPTNRWANYAELIILFFLHGMALGMWFVPLTTVLDAYGMHQIRPYAFATAALAACVSPLLFGAISDRHAGPVRVLRWIALAASALMALATSGIKNRWNPWLVLGLIQALSLFVVPAWSISTTIVLARLADAKEEFGPIRAVGTLGWMAGCWVVSLLNADASPLAGYCAAATWMALAAFTLALPTVIPPKSLEHLSVKQRLGLDALSLLKNHDHRVVFVTAALVTIPLAAFYPFTPPHLSDLGLERTSAWMTLGQVTEIVAMFGLSAVLTRWRLKWIFACGLGFALLRYLLCALDGKAWVLGGISLHGFAFTLFFVTVPIYLNERVDAAWRARAQALFTLMTSGAGSLIGYLGTGWWFAACERPDGMHWPLFWIGLAAAVGAVAAYFLVAYHGRGTSMATPRTAEASP
jgi:MFS family permease